MLHEEIRHACFRKCRIAGIHNIRTRHQPSAGMPQDKDNRTLRRKLTLSQKKAVAGELRAVRNKALRRAMFDARVKQLRNQHTPEV